MSVGILNGVVVLLAGWLFVSPFLLGYGATDAANDLVLGQIGGGILIAAAALPRVRQPAGRGGLTAVTGLAAVLLLAFPWLVGAVQNEPAGGGLPPGPADNYYAPTGSANLIVTSSCILVLTAFAAILVRRIHPEPDPAGITSPEIDEPA